MRPEHWTLPTAMPPEDPGAGTRFPSLRRRVLGVLRHRLAGDLAGQ